MAFRPRDALKKIFKRRPAAPDFHPAPEHPELEFVNSSPDLIMRCGPEMRVRYVSPSCLPILGYAPAELVGTGPADIVHPDDLHLIAENAASHQSGTTQSTELTFRVRHKNGSTVWLEVRGGTVPDRETGRPDGVALVMRDVTLRREMEDQLYQLALTDALTGVGNRRAFDQAILREWDRSQREASGLSLLLIDVDRFKEFNDRYGHQAGDDCLRAVAATIARVLRRPGDAAARYGGEEFAAILAGTNSAGAGAVAELLLQEVRALRLVHEKGVGGIVTVSIGAASASGRGSPSETAHSLIASADEALYRAKRSGRDQASFASLEQV